MRIIACYSCMHEFSNYFYSEGKVKRGTAPNVTSELLTSEPNVTTNGTVQNVTHHILEGNNNNSVSGK